MNRPTPHETDYTQWATDTAKLLRERRFDCVDIVHLAEEIEDLGKRQRQALKSNLRVLMMHLLKWDYQPEKRSGSWRATIREHRRRILDILEDSPSLKSDLTVVLPQCFTVARLQAADENGLPLEAFPNLCPYSEIDVLQE
ncbi:DUF29 family protein [Synechococcales cyanobacterium C]|uniref:DUF29 family protein n=1 Tax=Petrachloros mirabilis ULC683 TaxID=2781853 RepID=A0A8K1ZW14_9CYAN|nr:DUF29 domain-containing protein [Petrachloros mirabilis]NCJ06179.1 DUF29 family protein [Petrachloros mirabilis ULC683]